MKQRIVIISDTHGMHEKVTIPTCDILIHCGDWSNSGEMRDAIKFLKWFSKQDANNITYICGNHDRSYEKYPAFKKEMIDQYPDIFYLEDSGIEINGLKIWGSPYTPEFFNWSFMLPKGSSELSDKWDKIPRNTDILVTHGGPQNILDKSIMSYPPYPDNAGCELLRHRIEEIGTIKLHCFGHIHEAYGCNYHTLAPTTFINASICTRQYTPSNSPVVLEIHSVTKEVSIKM